jgi:hypothetical protein
MISPPAAAVAHSIVRHDLQVADLGPGRGGRADQAEGENFEDSARTLHASSFE